MSIHQLNTALGWAATMNEDEHMYNCTSLHSKSEQNCSEQDVKEKKTDFIQRNSDLHSDEQVSREEKTVFSRECSKPAKQMLNASSLCYVNSCNSDNANKTNMRYGSHPYLEQSLPELSLTTELSSSSLSSSLLSSSHAPLSAPNTCLPSSYYSSSFSSAASSSLARNRCYTKSPSSSFCVYPSNVSNDDKSTSKPFATCSCSSFVQQINSNEGGTSNNSASLENYLRSFTGATKEFLSTTCTTLTHSMEPSSSSKGTATAVVPTSSSSIIYSCHAELNHRRRRSSHRINVRPSSAPLHSSSATATHAPQPAKHQQFFSSRSKLKVKPTNLSFASSQVPSELPSSEIPVETVCKNATLSTFNSSNDTNGMSTGEIQSHATTNSADESLTQTKLDNNVSKYYINNDSQISNNPIHRDGSGGNDSRLSRSSKNQWCSQAINTKIKSDDNSKQESSAQELTSNGKSMSMNSQHRVALTRPPLAPSVHNIHIHPCQQRLVHQNNIIVNNYTNTCNESNATEAKHNLHDDNNDTTDEKNSVGNKNNSNKNKTASSDDSNNFEKHDVNETEVASQVDVDGIVQQCLRSDGNSNNVIDNESSTFDIKSKQTFVINQHESAKAHMTGDKSAINSKLLKQYPAERSEWERKMNERRVLIAQHVCNGDDYCVKHNYAAAEVNYTRAINISCLNSFLVMKRVYALLRQQHLQAAELDLRWVLYALQVEKQISENNANVHNTCAIRATFVQAYWLMAQLTLSSMHVSTCDVNRYKQKAIYYYDKALFYCNAIDVTLRSTYNQFDYNVMATPAAADNNITTDTNNTDTSKCNYKVNNSASVTNQYYNNKKEMLQKTHTHLDDDDDAQRYNSHKRFTRRESIGNTYDDFFTKFVVSYEVTNRSNPNKTDKGESIDHDSIEHNDMKNENDVHGGAERNIYYEGHIIVEEEKWEEEEQRNMMLWNENVSAIRAILTNEKEKLIDYNARYLHYLEKEEWLDATNYTQKIIALMKEEELNMHNSLQEACQKVNRRESSKETNEYERPFLFSNSWLVTLWSLRQIEVMLYYIPSTALHYVEQQEKKNYAASLEHFMVHFLKAKALFYTSHDKETTDECLRLLSQCEKANDVEELKYTSSVKEYATWSSHVTVPPNEIYDAECNELNSLLQSCNTFTSPRSNRGSKLCSSGDRFTLYTSSHMCWRTKCMHELKRVIEEFVEHRDLGNSCYLHGKYNASVRHYNTCLTLDLHNKSLLATTQCNLAAVEINRKQYWRALEHVNNAITMYKGYNNLEEGCKFHSHVNEANEKHNALDCAGKEENGMKSCTASCRDAAHKTETFTTKGNNKNTNSDNGSCFTKTSLSNNENLSKAFARRGRIYLQLFLRNVSLPTSTNKTDNDDKIRAIFMRKPEKHDNNNNNNDDDNDGDNFCGEEDKTDDCVYEGKKCKMTDATSQYQLNCITFSIKDFRHAIYLARGTSCDVEMLREQLSKARAQRQHFMQRWSHIRQNEANWRNESNSYSSNSNRENSYSYSYNSKYSNQDNNTSNYTSNNYCNGFASKNGKKGSSYSSFTASSPKSSTFRPSTASPYSTSYASYNCSRATPSSSETYSNYFSSSTSSSSSSMPYSNRNTYFTSHVNRNERAKLLKFLHLVEMPDSLLGKTSNSSSLNANDKSSSSSSTYFTNSNAEMNVNGNNNSNNVDALINSASSRQFINRVYKKAALQWHPDRWSNAPENQRHAAEQRFKEINTLYHELQDVHKERGNSF